MNTKEKTQRHAFTMRVDDDFEALVDTLRKLVTPTPTKSDAVRLAVLEAVERRQKRKP